MHVGDLDPVDRAPRRPEPERRSRVVGVHVHLERARIADDEKRIAEPLELALEFVGVEPLPLDHEHGAVTVLRELLVHGFEGERDRVRRRLQDGLARDGGTHPANDLEQPCPAGIDDPGLLEHREQVRCAGKRLLTARDDEGEQLGPLEPARLGRLRRLGHLPNHGQHRPLDRAANGAVRGVVRRAKCPRDHGLIDRVLLPEDIGEAADDLAEDHARVPARAHQRRAGQLAGDGLVPVGAWTSRARRRSPAP